MPKTVYLVVLLLLSSTFILIKMHTNFVRQDVKDHRKPSSTSRIIPALSADPAFNLAMNPDKRFIILVTSFRSGSTFLGKLFDENPQVQYLFEPIHHREIEVLYKRHMIFGASQRHTRNELKMLHLQQIFHNCTVFPSTVYHTRWTYCGDVQENIERFGTEDCPPKPRSSVADTCNYRKTSVLKVIRLRRLSDLSLIRNIKEANFQIIHYTRHPVGLMTSRQKGGHFFTWDANIIIEGKSSLSFNEGLTRLAWEAYTYCSEAIEIRRLLEKEPWLKERYLRVTHQQLSLDPIATAAKIYKHVELELSPEMVEFIKYTTTGKINDSALQPQMSTSRISKDIVFYWKKMGTSLKNIHLSTIDSVCRTMIENTREELSFDALALHGLLKLYNPASDADSSSII